MVTGFLHLHLDKIIDGGIAGALLEKAGEAGRTIVVPMTQVVEGDVLADMFLHEEDGAIDAIYLFGRGCDEMFLIINEQGDKMRETHIGKEQVVDAIAQFQGLINFAKQGDHLVTAADRAGFEMFLDDGQRIEIGQEASTEMQPVNGPGVLFATAIGMFYILW